MGFLGEFAYGFSQTAKPILQDQAKAEADADARIRERVQSVAPDTDLYQRKQDIDLAELQKKQTMERNNFGSSIQNMSDDAKSNLSSVMGGPTTSTTSPTPTISQGSPTASPNMTPTQSQPFVTPTQSQLPQPVKEPDPYSLYQEYKAKSAQMFAVGDKENAELMDKMAELQKTKMEHQDRTNKIEPTPNKSAEGINVNEQLVKDADANDKANGTSFYAPEFASVFAQPDSTMNWKGDKYYAENVHTPLAQAEMAHQRKLTPDKPETEVFGIVKQNTLTPTSDIATLEMNNPHITVSQKQQAMQDLMSYMKSTYGNDIDAAIAQDKNLQHVLNTKLLNTMTTIANQAKPQPTPME